MSATRSRLFSVRYSLMHRGHVARRASLYVKAITQAEALDEACRIFAVLGLDLRVQITSIH